MSGAASTIGSGSSSEWGREYEDEDTWYEFSSAYQSGADTHLIPSRDTGLALRMAKYRRTGGSRKDRKAAEMIPDMPKVSKRSLMKERRDLRDLEKEEELPVTPAPHSRHHRRGVHQLKHLTETGNVNEEGNEGVMCASYQHVHDINKHGNYKCHVNLPDNVCKSDPRSQKPVTGSLKSNHLLPFGFPRQKCDVDRLTDCVNTATSRGARENDVYSVGCGSNENLQWVIMERQSFASCTDTCTSLLMYYSEDNTMRELESPPSEVTTTGGKGAFLTVTTDINCNTPKPSQPPSPHSTPPPSPNVRRRRSTILLDSNNINIPLVSITPPVVEHVPHVHDVQHAAHRSMRSGTPQLAKVADEVMKRRKERMSGVMGFLALPQEEDQDDDLFDDDRRSSGTDLEESTFSQFRRSSLSMLRRMSFTAMQNDENETPQETSVAFACPEKGVRKVTFLGRKHNVVHVYAACLSFGLFVGVVTAVLICLFIYSIKRIFH